MVVVFVGNHLMHINKRSMFTALSLFGNNWLHEHSLRGATAVKKIIGLAYSVYLSIPVAPSWSMGHP
jgi:hypothetical protein